VVAIRVRPTMAKAMAMAARNATTWRCTDNPDQAESICCKTILLMSRAFALSCRHLGRAGLNIRLVRWRLKGIRDTNSGKAMATAEPNMTDSALPRKSGARGLMTGVALALLMGGA